MLKKCLVAVVGCWYAVAISQPNDVEAGLSRMLEGTLFVKPKIETADGILKACGLEFSAIQKDFSTKAGAAVTLSGSFSLRLTPTGGVAYALKLGVIDGFSSMKPVAPANAFIRAPQGKVPKKALRLQSDSNGYALFVGALDEDVVAAYAGIVDSRKLDIGFNRTAGQQDVTTTLDLTVIDSQMGQNEVIRKRSNAPVDEFFACTGSLLKMARPSK